jgi:flagella basal body P-ring formation protein FlgA
MILRSFLSIISLTTALFWQPSYASVDVNEIQLSAQSSLDAHHEQLLKQYGENVRIEASLGNIDPRLSLADCAEPLESTINGRATTGRINIKVSCPTGPRWSIFVPGKINLYREVITVLSPVNRGNTLSSAQLSLQEMNISLIHGQYFTQMDAVNGMQVKRTLRPGQPILASQLEPPIVIKKGDSVVVTASSGTLDVKSPGIALMDGRKGQQISVKNRRSKRVVETRVTGPGQVAVTM